MTSGAPKDHYHIVYISCFVLGVGTLFAWNALITAAGYFSSRFCGESYEKTFEEDIGLAYMSANVVSLALVVKYQDKLPRKARVIFAIIAYFLLFAGITFMVLLPDLSASSVYGFTIVAGALSGVFCALLTGGVFSMVSQFPGVYVGAVMSGQGLSGLTASLVSLGTAFGSDLSCSDDDGDDANDDDENCSDYNSVDWGSFSYFLVSCVIFLMCIVAYVVMESAPFAKHFDEEAVHTQVGETYSPLGGGGGDEEPDNSTRSRDKESIRDSARESLKDQDALAHDPPTKDDTLFGILWKVRREAFSAWAVFTVTIAIFPGITALVRPEHCNVFPDALFTPFMFVMFNGVDLIGRTAAGFIQIVPAKYLPLACIGRAVFLPLFAFMNVQGSQLPVLFPGVVSAAFIMFAMALSNGYFSTLAMIYGPLRVDHKQTEMAGSVMIFSLTFGLFCGAMLAYLVSFVVVG